MKSAGLVPFMDHFAIPTVLSKYRKKLLNLCGLKEDTLGRSGLQEKNVEHWINAKVNETKCDKLCVSLAMDGKKIAMSSDGVEDMGTTSGQTVEEVKSNETSQLLSALATNERESLFAAYDSLTSISQEISMKISGINSLIKKNSRLADKNPLLVKYIFILNEQLKKGSLVIGDIEKLQMKVLKMLSEKRKSKHLLPNAGSVDLSRQENYRKLSTLSQTEDEANIQHIQSMVGSSLLKFPWSKLFLNSRNIARIPQKSQTFDNLLKNCFLFSDDIFKACGLKNASPLQDMKSAYIQSHSNNAEERLNHETPNNVVATMSAIISPMIFGNKCYVAESGLFIENGIASTPAMLVYNTSDELEYVVRTVYTEENKFDCKLETIAMCIVDAYLSKSKSGCLLILYSNTSCVCFMIQNSSGLAKEMLSLVTGFIRADKCIGKRTKELISRINAVRSELKLCSHSTSILGSFPMAESVQVSDTVHKDVVDFLLNPFPSSPSSSGILDMQQLKKDVQNLIETKFKFLSKKARELIAINASDMSGMNSSTLPHTILCGTFLTSNSLKVVGKECLDSAITLINSRGGEVLNIAVDGESLNMATTLRDGFPGTLLALTKYLAKNIKSLSKEALVEHIVKNKDIKLATQTEEEFGMDEDVELDEIDLTEGNLEEHMEDSIAAVSERIGALNCCEFTSEDIEEWLKGDSTTTDQAKLIKAKEMKLLDLRMSCLKYILPKAKHAWMMKAVGREKITIQFEDGSTVPYFPNTVFDKTKNGYFLTVSFDMAHISNLCRESAAKGKLQNLGLNIDNLKTLSEMEGFDYLKRIISLKNNNTLEFDPMNQKASAALFSEKTVSGLKSLNDFEGAKCVEVISKGIVEALDKGGIQAQERIQNIMRLKSFIEENNYVVDRMTRAGKEFITNELYQMILITLDSHIYTYINMDYFHPRRKSTSTVEQFFGQLMLLADGGTKLNCRQISNVLSRVMLTNALRMVPAKKKGFHFLTKLGVHMKSYTVPETEDDGETPTLSRYPSIKQNRTEISPIDSPFDRNQLKRKLFNISKSKGEHVGTSDGNVRKFFKRF